MYKRVSRLSASGIRLQITPPVMDCVGVMLHSWTASDTPTPATVDSRVTTNAIACRVELDGEFLHRPPPWLCGRRAQRLPKIRDISHESHQHGAPRRSSGVPHPSAQCRIRAAELRGQFTTARQGMAIHNGDYCGLDNRRQSPDNRRGPAQNFSPL